MSLVAHKEGSFYLTHLLFGGVSGSFQPSLVVFLARSSLTWNVTINLIHLDLFTKYGKLWYFWSSSPFFKGVGGWGGRGKWM